ncbi:hypothetical protein PR048_011799 [Dryococelus australis]|uniref:Uncharacterized protein n=1 Tax=Dryococelus australis TaxID=614101 RepID=A0ABQ9HMJ0_9NEOP|nr:hypothetical protein PR048_011799 [Dryococelus australis]
MLYQIPKECSMHMRLLFIILHKKAKFCNQEVCLTVLFTANAAGMLPQSMIIFQYELYHKTGELDDQNQVRCVDLHSMSTWPTYSRHGWTRTIFHDQSYFL